VSQKGYEFLLMNLKEIKTQTISGVFRLMNKIQNLDLLIQDGSQDGGSN